MKKIVMLLTVLSMLCTTSCAQQPAKPAQKVKTSLTEAEMNAKLQPFFEKLQAIPEDGNEEAALKAAAMEFIAENRNDAGVYVIRSVLAYTMSPEELIKFVDADEFFSQDETIVKCKQDWQVQAATGEGKMFRDFEATYDGKTVRLSDYVGKGKYVLVDFWASWCGPCKREIPNLIKVYEKYKGDKFEVLGVATWDKPEDTLKSIEQLGIKYPQMINAQKAGSDAYGISGIPQIILFGPDGTILKRNLRGENIEKAISELNL